MALDGIRTTKQELKDKSQEKKEKRREG